MNDPQLFTDTDTGPGAEALLTDIRRSCERIYHVMPRMLGLTRSGHGDGAYVDDVATGALKALTPRRGTHYDRAALARLVLAYAAHDDRDEARITRHPKHPTCLDLYLG